MKRADRNQDRDRKSDLGIEVSQDGPEESNL